MNNSGFKRGSGCYTCICCGRKTRETGHDCDGTIFFTKTGVVGTCRYCYEMGGIENMLSDSGLKHPTKDMISDWEFEFAECVKHGGIPETSFRSSYEKEPVSEKV